MTKLSDYVMRRVAETGVRDVFLLPGGGCMHLVDSLGRNKDLRFICNLHEQAAAIAADAYAQYTGNLGVALVTTGPGGTNAVTGVAGSWLDSIPTLILSGQVKRPDLLTGRGVRQMGFQEINIVDIVRPITKYAVLIDDPRQVRYHFDKASIWPSTAGPAPSGSIFPSTCRPPNWTRQRCRPSIRPSFPMPPPPQTCGRKRSKPSACSTKPSGP